MPQSYKFHCQLIMRAPVRPFAAAISAETIAGLRHDPSFLEALYLASPVLWGECQKWQRGELTDARRLDKLQRSLTRYYVRATTRCTPFGLFAGCAVATWGAATRLQLAAGPVARHTRLDMHYLCALAQQLASRPVLRTRLRYWPATSLYAIGEEFRYVEYQYLDGKRVNQLSAVAATPPVAQVLQAAQGGSGYAALLAVLDPEASHHSEAAAFLDELIQAQVLTHELEPTVTGPEFFMHIQAVLARLLVEAPHPEITALADCLREVSQHLHSLDQAPVNDPAHYEHLVALLAPLGVPQEAGKLFQTDTIQHLDPAADTVDVAVQADLLAALQLLRRLTPPPSAGRLADFTNRFSARYEEQEVPLLEALDNESGLSYTTYGQNPFSPLVQDLVVPAAGPPAPEALPGPVLQVLARKLRQAAWQRQYSVELTADDLRDCPATTLPLPPSLAVMFRLIGEEQVLLESAGGSSAVNLLGRFAHANPAIGQLVRDVTAHEQDQNPAVAFAEICHLPAHRIGNVLLRPSFRRLEIAYLAQAALPAEGQVRVQDLRLAVRGGQLVLHCCATGQRIIPRLSTAHNFTHEVLPVYQFLCDLQTQGLQPYLGVCWPATEGTAFLPRLTYRRVVLAPATWQLTAADLQPLLAAPAAEQVAALAAFRRQWQLPRWFVLAEGDNELLVDADNAWLVRTWLETVRLLPSVQLKEFLFDPATSPVRDALGRPYPQQLVALLLGQHPCYPALVPRPAPAPSVPRDFALGSEWLYYKLYCGPQRANYLLTSLVRPLTEELAEAGLIDNWFFIRYADPDNHLRLRLHLRHPDGFGQAVQLVAHHLQPFQAGGAVWKVQADTYRRELERYGSRTVVLSEQLFGWQSQALLVWLAEQPAGDAPESWLWGLGSIDELLDAFAYSLAQKTALLLELRTTFAHEFGAHKSLRLQLDTKYRAARPTIAAYLTERPPVPAALGALAEGIKQQLAAGPPEVVLADLLMSYLHMLLNRLLPAEARLHELVLYDFLHRYYQARLAQSVSPG